MKKDIEIDSRWIWHVLYWIGAALFLSFFYGYRSTGFQVTLWLVVLLLPVSIGTTYFFIYFLIPRYLIKKRYFQFTLYSFYTIIVSVYLELIVLVFVLIVIAGLDFGLANFEPLFFLAGMYIPVLLAITANLYSGWRKLDDEHHFLAKQKAEAELRFLKSQLHPHFLFNTLNNLYALALEKSDKLPEMILKLADLLHFILYESSNDKIPLEKELEQVRNYIELEKLRFENNDDIKIEVSGDVEKASILPLSILTLVENGFKHGIQQSQNQGWLKIFVNVLSNRISVSVTNSIGKQASKSDEKGIGLSNLQSRLKLIYKDQYKLVISGEEDSHKVQMNLE